MKIVSVNVGLPRQIVHEGRPVSTGIYKSPVRQRVKVRKLNIKGDGQADLSVHGGANKAVYAYPSEHYEYWRHELPGIDLPWGMFGENLTLKGLLENNACIGDRFRVGTAVLMVTQPRLPCYKLGIKFGQDEMPERFLSSRRTGFYFAVVQEGELGEGDTLEHFHSEPGRISVADLLHLYYDQRNIDVEEIQRVLQVAALTSGWRKRLQKRLGELSSAAANNLNPR